MAKRTRRQTVEQISFSEDRTAAFYLTAMGYWEAIGVEHALSMIASGKASEVKA
jgi:hypothetical protein